MSFGQFQDTCLGTDQKTRVLELTKRHVGSGNEIGQGNDDSGTSSARAFCSTHITSFNQSCPNKILKAYNFLI